MKKMKLFAATAMMVTAGYFGYTAYKQANMTDAERMMLSNLEALTQGEAESHHYDCYSILEGAGQSIDCSTYRMAVGTPPWYHFGSTCVQ